MDRIFEEEVALKYRLYNSIFLTLPFAGISDTGHLLPLLHNACDAGLKERKAPTEILDTFFKEHAHHLTEAERIGLMFRFVQYIERQVVLFDALEDAAYEKIHGVADQYSLTALFRERNNPTEQRQLRAYLNNYGVRVVLTAHPTQFYPGRVLSIITDLEKSIRDNNVHDVQELLRQLGRTPFYNREKPTPLEEAVSLIWYLENVFYHSIGELLSEIEEQLGSGFNNHHLLQLGFWPGGDRDGNPFVDAATTKATGALLRKSVLRSYLNHLHRLKRRLTFPETEERIRGLERQLEAMIQGETGMSLEAFTEELEAIKEALVQGYDSLFVDRVDDLLRRVKAFGFYFASLDLRQDSRVHHSVVLDILCACGTMQEFEALNEEEAMDFLLETPLDFATEDLNEMSQKTLESIRVMKQLQAENGERAAHRYIISNTQSALNLAELMFLFRAAGYEGAEVPVDWVPLFETVDDLEAAPEIMNRLWDWEPWAKHTSARKGQQPIMLGFSDGTKDGGYLMANWGIYRAKEELTAAARERGHTLIFFDGRGGPPARGGGKTHQFYASLGNTVENSEIHLTIQGQTISSNFGTVRAAKHNLGQLLTAGMRGKLASDQSVWTPENRSLMEELSSKTYQAYVDLKNHPDFLDYLSEMTVLKYYGATNIGSRPSKRSGGDQKLNLGDLRAIPYVGSWSQMKQNVPGFYGLGQIFQEMKDAGRQAEVRDLYLQVPFFRALLNNSMQSLTKANYPLSAYIEKDKQFGAFWKSLEGEYERSKERILDLTNMNELMDDAPLGRASIRLREEIITPLLVIQQAALLWLREGSTTQEEALTKLVIRCFFGNINATRNAA